MFDVISSNDSIFLHIYIFRGLKCKL
uniref:Uncharacterized protein n=1 Tax=Anguilla anguilla TaxID=7936 RepID=A0A0E9RYZ5_ANGAN